VDEAVFWAWWEFWRGSVVELRVEDADGGGKRGLDAFFVEVDYYAVREGHSGGGLEEI